MRFQLDPQGEAPVRPPPPAPPTSAPVVAAPAVAAATAPKRRWILVLAVAALLLVAGGGLGAYVMKVGPFAYPDRYLLQKGEEPRGTRLGALNPQIGDVLGITKNPGQMSADKIDELLAQGGDQPRPSQAWAEDVSTATFGSDVLVFAIKYASDADATQALGHSGSLCDRGVSAGGAALRDGSVVVIVAGSTPSALSAAHAVQKAIVAKSPSLASACSF